MVSSQAVGEVVNQLIAGNVASLRPIWIVAAQSGKSSIVVDHRGRQRGQGGREIGGAEDRAVVLIGNDQVVGRFRTKRTVPTHLPLILRLGADCVKEWVDLVGERCLDTFVFLQAHKNLVVVGNV